MLSDLRRLVPNLFVVVMAVIVLSACVVPKRVGGFEVSGTVVDKDTGDPIPGVKVLAYYSVTSAYGVLDHPVIGEAVTDEFGEFSFEAARRTVVGGIGGWSGRIDKSPNFKYEKAGYCASGRFSGRPDDEEPPTDAYVDIHIELEKQTGSCGETIPHM